MLYHAYGEAYNLNSNSHKNYISNYNSVALQFASSSYCVEGTVFQYSIDSFDAAHHNYPASLCTLNLNPRSDFIQQPTPDFHLSVHGIQTELANDLLEKAQHHFQDAPEFDFKFYDFDNLDYNLQCNSGSNELMQVMYREEVLQVTIRIHVSVPEKCSFYHLNPDLTDVFDKSSTYVQIPITGDFSCSYARTAWCKKELVGNATSTRI